MNITQLSEFKNKCTGCLACIHICPVQCLRCEKDSEGFYYPVIDSEKCIDCGKCANVCSVNKENKNTEHLSIVAGYAKDGNICMQGSSGGITVLLSELVKNRDGIVFGAVFDSKKNKVMHKSSEEVSIEALSRSKYVQSYIGETFFSVKKELDKGREVLFCATPCQVQGLKNYLGKEYSNLYTVDFFCHGVPSSGLFEEMLDKYEKIYESKVTDVLFRDKFNGWRSLSLSLRFENSKEVRISSKEQPYYYYFLNNYSLRKSCYSCTRYKSHLSEITVADYWTVDKKFDNNDGMSLIIINSEKGKKLFEKIREEVNVVPVNKDIDFSIYEHNYSLKNREKFFEEYKSKGIEYVFTEMFNKVRFKRDTIAKIKLKIIGFLRK